MLVTKKLPQKSLISYEFHKHFSKLCIALMPKRVMLAHWHNWWMIKYIEWTSLLLMNVKFTELSLIRAWLILGALFSKLPNYWPHFQFWFAIPNWVDWTIVMLSYCTWSIWGQPILKIEILKIFRQNGHIFAGSESLFIADIPDSSYFILYIEIRLSENGPKRLIKYH